MASKTVLNMFRQQYWSYDSRELRNAAHELVDRHSISEIDEELTCDKAVLLDIAFCRWVSRVWPVLVDMQANAIELS